MTKADARTLRAEGQHASAHGETDVLIKVDIHPGFNVESAASGYGCGLGNPVRAAAQGPDNIGGGRPVASEGQRPHIQAGAVCIRHGGITRIPARRGGGESEVFSARGREERVDGDVSRASGI